MLFADIAISFRREGWAEGWLKIANKHLLGKKVLPFGPESPTEITGASPDLLSTAALF